MVENMPSTRRSLVVLLAFACLPIFSVIATQPATSAPTLGDGTTPTVTPQGTFIVPPPGAPMLIVPAPDVVEVTDALGWGPEFLPDPLAPSSPASAEGATGSRGDAGALACTNYRVGRYETNDFTISGGHAGIIPNNLPPDTSAYCAGTGMGYTVAVSLGANSWIQDGLAVMKGESRAKTFCQANNNGALTTRYGPANAYDNGATVFLWFARDSSGVWRTYYYQTGTPSFDLGCSLTAPAASQPVQWFGEIQGATSTAAPMGWWWMYDFRYLHTGGSWYNPSTVRAFYPGATPCPPYGAGGVNQGFIKPGSGRPCDVGDSPYPN